MAPATLPAVPPTPTLPAPYRWTVDGYRHGLYLGVWEGKKVLLIDGELIEVPAPDPIHDMALTLAYYLLMRIFAAGYVVRVQMGMALSLDTDPLPDLAVVPGDPRTVTVHPPTAALVLEVSSTSLAFDTGEKASLYAAAGVRDYWVTDIHGRRVIVHRNPTPDPAQKYGHGYASVTVLVPGQSLAPLAAPQSPVAAADLLP